MILPFAAAAAGAIAGIVLPILGWYTGPAWIVHTQHIPLTYPLVGAAAGWFVGFGAAMMVVG